MLDKERISSVIQSIKIEVIRDKEIIIVLSTQLENNSDTIKILKEVLKLLEMEASQSSTN